MAKLSDPRGFRKIVAGVCMIAAPALLVVAEIIHPREREGESEQGKQVRPVLAAGVCGDLGEPLRLVAVPGDPRGDAHAEGAPAGARSRWCGTRALRSRLARRRRRHGVRRLAGGEGAWNGRRSDDVLDRPDHRQSRNAAALPARPDAPSRLACARDRPLPVARRGGLGGRARCDPRYRRIVSEIAYGPRIIPIVTSILFLIGLGSMGLRVLRQTDEEWEQTPELRGAQPVTGST